MFLKRVDKLTITFLVDNTIEWMTKLPPGFTHEVVEHLHHNHTQKDEITGVPTFDFNNFCCGAHGFGALIETYVECEQSTHLTLFDTGPDSSSLVRNIHSMETPIADIERVVTSHWHADHTGGLLSMLELRRNTHPDSAPCIIDVHPDRPIARSVAPGPTFDKVMFAIPRDPSFEQIAELGGIVEKHNEGHAVAGGAVWVSGEIPRVTDYETGILGGMRWVETLEGGGAWVKEKHIMDERYVAIDVAGKGLVIFSACSHAGIINVVIDAVKTFNRPVYMVIGGLHLAGHEYGSRIPPTVEFLSKHLRPAPTYVLPMHCSGFQVKLALEATFGGGCVPAGVGHKVEVIGERGNDDLLVSMTIQ